MSYNLILNEKLLNKNPWFMGREVRADLHDAARDIKREFDAGNLCVSGSTDAAKFAARLDRWAKDSIAASVMTSGVKGLGYIATGISIPGSMFGSMGLGAMLGVPFSYAGVLLLGGAVVSIPVCMGGVGLAAYADNVVETRADQSFLRWAKDNGYVIGPSRGGAAGAEPGVPHHPTRSACLPA
jgi:hypothetical protein